MIITTFNSSLKTSKKSKLVSVSKSVFLVLSNSGHVFFSGKNDAIGNGLLSAGDFISAHSDVNISDPFAVLKAAYAAGSEFTQAAADARVKKLEDEANDLCIRMID